MVRIGIIGAGDFGKKIISKLNHINGISYEVIATSTDNWKGFIGCDWVIIATPTEFHYEQVLFYLNSGVNVFCEKPCTLSYDSTLELIELAKKKRVRLYIDDVLCYDNVQLQNNTFIYKKWSNPKGNLIDRIMYHHLYLLYNVDIENSMCTDIQHQGSSFQKRISFQLGKEQYSFDYDFFHYKSKVHNVVFPSDRDALTTMLESVFTGAADFELNHKRSLFATRLSEQLKKHVYGSIAVIGGGIYGVTTAIKLKDSGYHVDLFEKESDILKAASGINQYRLHRGYHYPRSKETIASCRDNERSFLRYYQDAIVGENVQHLYCVAKEESLITAVDYLKVLDESGLKWKLETPMPNCDITVSVDEKLYDPDKLRELCKQRLHGNGVVVKLNTPWAKKRSSLYKKVVYATYAGLNRVTQENVDYQYELCEKPLFKLPEHYRNKSIVIMDGPFMCFDPYADTEYHLGGNVVHAIHVRNVGKEPEIPKAYKNYLNNGLITSPKLTNYSRFIESARPFFPDIDQAEHIGSMYTIRTVLPNKDATDERPTIVRKLSDNEFVIFSGKVVNCIDAANKITKLINE